MMHVVKVSVAVAVAHALRVTKPGEPETITCDWVDMWDKTYYRCNGFVMGQWIQLQTASENEPCKNNPKQMKPRCFLQPVGSTEFGTIQVQFPRKHKVGKKKLWGANKGDTGNQKRRLNADNLAEWYTKLLRDYPHVTFAKFQEIREKHFTMLAKMNINERDLQREQLDPILKAVYNEWFAEFNRDQKAAQLKTIEQTQFARAEFVSDSRPNSTSSTTSSSIRTPTSATLPAAEAQPSRPSSKEIVFGKGHYVPQSEHDLAFELGDQIVVTHKYDNGWWVGYNSNDPTAKKGNFPANWVGSEQPKPAQPKQEQPKQETQLPVVQPPPPPLPPTPPVTEELTKEQEQQKKKEFEQNRLNKAGLSMWQAGVDPSTDKFYYYNTQTQESRWETPIPAAPQPVMPTPPPPPPVTGHSDCKLSIATPQPPAPVPVPTPPAPVDTSTTGSAQNSFAAELAAQRNILKNKVVPPPAPPVAESNSGSTGNAMLDAIKNKANQIRENRPAALVDVLPKPKGPTPVDPSSVKGALINKFATTKGSDDESDSDSDGDAWLN
jgi:hypothetical protein